MIDYATTDDVNKRLAGDMPQLSGAFDETKAGKVSEISRDLDRMVAEVRGVTGTFTIVADETASERTFQPKSGPARSWPIDDCIELEAVTLTLTPAGEATVLVEGTDYVVSRARGVIVALRSLSGRWPDFPAQLGVTARWGLMTAVSADLREACVLEVIRSYLGDRAGNDDRIGMTPFGAVVTAKAYTSKVTKFVTGWTYGGGGMR